ncbi:MAG: alpha/beta fold hydrolase [Candidatus Levybacteria bacterium]|nr:alpha/beta fold hydrolase [Candidatus Levybacteria bacterium]
MTTLANEIQEDLVEIDESKSSAKKSKMKYILVLAIIVIAIFLIASQSLSGLMEKSKGVTQKIAESVESLPFKELTIPHLREREYQGSLGELDQISTNTNYTSYLTSYTSDGLKINALMTRPAGAEPEGGWPAIVFIHGYIPPTLYVTTEKYVDYVDYLARNEFVVLKIDLRGHGESEGDPGGGYYGSDYVIDALNAYAALQSADFVNKEKIGMWGHSMAGNILLRSAVVKKTIPAIVIWAGAVYSYEDQRKYGINDNSYRPPMPSAAQQQNQNRRQSLFAKVGSPSAQSLFWKQVAPTNYLNDLQGAIELHHAVNDDVVNVGYSRDLITLLDKTSVPHELFEYSTGGHNIDGSSFGLAMQRTVAFYKKHLQ